MWPLQDPGYFGFPIPVTVWVSSSAQEGNPVSSFLKRRNPAYQHGGMSKEALEVAGAEAEYALELVQKRVVE